MLFISNFHYLELWSIIFIIINILFILFLGKDTTSLLLSTAIHQISMNKDIEEALLEEIENFGRYRSFTNDDLTKVINIKNIFKYIFLFINLFGLNYC